MTPMKEPICIWGSSARAACWSAIRAGLKPHAFDTFQDLDFPTECLVQLILPERVFFREELQEDQRKPCLPVGGWENDAEMMLRLESQFLLWNTTPARTQLARDPFLVQQVLDDHNLPTLRVRQASDELKTGEWVRKPLCGTGGIGIRRNATTTTETDHEYDQQFIPGDSYSAIFFASREGEIKLLGITAQLIGCQELPHRPFAYVGSMGPVLSGKNDQERAILATLKSMAEVLNDRIRFYGLICFDFVIGQGIPYLTEINPRYSASVEVLELALQKSFLLNFLNTAVVDPESSGQQVQTQSKMIGKAILYASQDCQISEDWDWNLFASQFGKKTWKYNQWMVPTVSDLPAAGTRFSTGDPICTVWAQGDSDQECDQELQLRTALLKKILKIS